MQAQDIERVLFTEEALKARVAELAAQIDQEVQRLVADAYDRCERILNDNRDKLEAVASYLLEHETMEREAFLAVFGEQPLSLKKEEV